MTRRLVTTTTLAVALLALSASVASADELDDYIDRAADASYAGQQATWCTFSGETEFSIVSVENAGSVLLVEAAGSLGVVKEIHIFNTIMTTLDNKRVIIPNGKVTGDTIVNYSAEGILRVDMEFGISYGDHIPKAKEILQKIIAEDPRVLEEPASTVAVKELGDSSVNFVVRPYVKVEDYWGVFFDVTEKVKMTFDSRGVSIPFPQRDVHMYAQATA